MAFIVKDERGILAIKQDNVDLVAECSLAIDDVRGCRLIALREVCLKELKPDALAGIALGAGVGERLSCGRQAPLDVVVQAGEKLGQGPVCHVTIWLQLVAFKARSAAALILVLSAVDREINSVMKKEASVIHDMNSLPEQERVQFWHEEFMPLIVERIDESSVIRIT